MKKIISIFLLAVILILPTGCLNPNIGKSSMKPIKLTYWRVWDEHDAFADIIAKYKIMHPNITIEYRKFRYEEYENELLNAFAEDRGPDIFSIPNTWVRKYQTKIEPLPDSVTMVYPVEKGSLKKEVFWEPKTVKSITAKEVKNTFVDAVGSDVVVNIKDEKTGNFKEKVMGLPLYVDTLAMFYNKDLFNNAGIPEPPLYWNKTFQQYVKKLTKQDTKGQIVQSGVALGGGGNVDRSIDILAALMMQNGAVMQDERGSVLFASVPPGQERNYSPGTEALRFYTDFANPSKEVYSWNKDMENSIKMFTQNKLAILFGYSYNIPTIKQQAPKLNYAISRLPQIEDGRKEINFANYWVETVSKKSKNVNEAWDFVQFATKSDQAKIYLEKTKRPPALRSLVEKMSENEEIGVFVKQVLTAKTWYRGKNADSAEKIMEEMIDAIAGGQELTEQINLAQSRVQSTVQ